MDEPSGDDEPDYAGLVRGLLEDLAGTSITSLELRQGELRVALHRVPGAGGIVSPATEATVVEKSRPLYWHVVEVTSLGLQMEWPVRWHAPIPLSEQLWAGVLPLKLVPGQPQEDAQSQVHEVPEYLEKYSRAPRSTD